MYERSCPTFAALLLLAVTASCTPAEPDAISVDVLPGRWDITVASRAGSCDGADSGRTVYLTVPATIPITTPTAYITGHWAADTLGGPTDSLTGNVDLDHGTVFLRLWKTILVTGAQLDGTVDRSGHFTGTLTDPAPGYAPIFVTTTCVFPASGTIRP